MRKSFKSIYAFLGRGVVPALFFFMSPLGAGLFAETYVTPNGIIMERVSEEDCLQQERLDDEADAENKIAAENRSSLAGENTSSDENSLTDGDIDALFDDENQDSESAIHTPSSEIVKVDPKNKPVTFYGSLKAELGAYLWFNPWQSVKPLASFRNILGFTGRPSQNFYITGSLLTDFPKMDIGLYELYFDYTMFGKSDLRVGKYDIQWKGTRLLDSDILDDKTKDWNATGISVSDYEEDKLSEKQRSSADSQFVVDLKIPFLSIFTVEGVLQYINNGKDYYSGSSLNPDNFSQDWISAAAKLEGVFGPFSVSLFTRKWAVGTYDESVTDSEGKSNCSGDGIGSPAFGTEIVSTVLGNNSNIFLQGLAFYNRESTNGLFNRSRLTAGVYKYWEAPLRLGVCFEYQFWYNDDPSWAGDSYNHIQHYIAAQIGWSRTFFGKKATFGLDWFHNLRGDWGTFTPVVKIDDVLKFVSFRVAMPVYYGTTNKVGLLMEAVMKLDY